VPPAGRALAVAVPVLLTAGIVVAGCADDDAASTSELCPTIQAWTEANREVVDAFRFASRELDPDERRTRYAASFAALGDLRDQLREQLADLELADPVVERLDAALAVVEETIDDGAAEATALPDAAYQVRAVHDGSLVTGVEKANAVVLAALNELADDSSTGIPRGCGRPPSSSTADTDT
jgi:hypothetical protein